MKRTLKIYSRTATHGVLVSSLKMFLGKQKIGFPGKRGNGEMLIRVQTFSYKMKFWVSNVQPGDYS